MNLWGIIIGTSTSFTLLSCCASFIQIRDHIYYNRYDIVRKEIVRILLMVPVYGLASWISLLSIHSATFFSVLRECYEAFAIYSFFLFLVQYLGGKQKLAGPYYNY